MNKSETSCGLFDALGNVQIMQLRRLLIWCISSRAGALGAFSPVFEFRGHINKDRRTVRSGSEIQKVLPLSL